MTFASWWLMNGLIVVVFIILMVTHGLDPQSDRELMLELMYPRLEHQKRGPDFLFFLSLTVFAWPVVVVLLLLFFLDRRD